MQLKKFQVINSPFPIIFIKNSLKKRLCNKIAKEIELHNNYDDNVMGGRNRINKGSNNFFNFLKISKNSKRFYSKINNHSYFKEIKKIFDKNFPNIIWNIPQFKFFSKKNYGLQKGKDLVMEKSKKSIVNLDMDFSLSNSGYAREPHRDRETRIINFLVYLNTIPKNYGGALKIYSLKKNTNKKKILESRFPNKKNIRLEKKFFPKKGDAIIFLSSPDSYHGVSKFKPNGNHKRVFIYGSFSLNKSVEWVKKTNLY
jgi:Rps23 Pro-64 3,4-dihydroxylase Tpa1-like proline 4-hydroxylase|tara:strand:- start:1118 stop:1885 length:768 start_codon:yes stop_codon:yes gene_type:complete